MATTITDLPVDALSNILASVAKLSGGAVDIAKSMSVCKHFLKAGKSNIVLKVVCFQQVEVVKQYRLFQRTDGLLFNCASAGNLFAQFLLAQVILKSSTQLRKRFGIKSARLKKYRGYCLRYNTGHIKFQEGYLVASFMASFVRGRDPRPFSYHWELVKVFLSNCTPADIYNMHRDIQAYVEYFTGKRIGRGTDADVFLLSLRSMCDPHSKYTSLFKYIGEYFYLRKGSTSLDSLTRDANVVVEEMRVKALHAFDWVSCGFPDFVASKKKE